MHSAEKGGAEKHSTTDRSDTEMDIEGGGQAGMSQTRHKKRHMKNIYLTDSHEEATVTFACWRGLLTAENSQSVNHYVKLMQSRSCQAPNKITESELDSG